MEQFTRRVRQIGRAFFDSRGIVAVVGIVLSVVLHECFHIVTHWGNITRIQFFPDNHAIMTVIATTSVGYDVRFEEMVAYMITFATLIVTSVVVAKLHDRRDARSTTQIIIPKRSSLRTLSQEEFFELAGRIRLL